MNRIPIVFAFDNNLSFPAAVCIYSLLANAKPTTTYDIFILHHKDERLNLNELDTVIAHFPRHSYQLRQVDDTFNASFEIRGITTPAYYRLLIPRLIPEYDKVIYSDVDVIFRQDLADVYAEDLGDNYIAGVNNLAHLDNDLTQHYNNHLHLNPQNIICSGFLVMNCELIRKHNLVNKFLEHTHARYKFQDQDILNITCCNHIKMLSPKYSVLTYIAYMAVYKPSDIEQIWSKSEINETLSNGNIHYNGQKPWKGYCVNFDIWWEYYRKSPIFNEKFYFDFFYNKLDELDQLSLMKRVKILVRYFTHHRK